MKQLYLYLISCIFLTNHAAQFQGFLFNGSTHPDWKELDVEMLGKSVALINPNYLTNVVLKINKELAANVELVNVCMNEENSLLVVDEKINFLAFPEKNLWVPEYNLLSEYVNAWRISAYASPQYQQCALYYALLKKITNYPELKDLLLSTNNQTIYYASTNARLGYNATTKMGQNWVGQALTNIRNNLQNVPVVEKKQIPKKLTVDQQADILLKQTAVQQQQRQALAAAQLATRKAPHNQPYYQSALATKIAALQTSVQNYSSRFYNWSASWWDWLKSKVSRSQEPWAFYKQ